MPPASVRHNCPLHYFIIITHSNRRRPKANGQFFSGIDFSFLVWGSLYISERFHRKGMNKWTACWPLKTAQAANRCELSPPFSANRQNWRYSSINLCTSRRLINCHREGRSRLYCFHRPTATQAPIYYHASQLVNSEYEYTHITHRHWN